MDVLIVNVQTGQFRRQATANPPFRRIWRFSKGPAAGASGQTPPSVGARQGMHRWAPARGPLAAPDHDVWIRRVAVADFALLQQLRRPKSGVIRTPTIRRQLGRVSARSFITLWLASSPAWCLPQSVGLACGAATVGDGIGQRHSRATHSSVAGRL